MKTILLAASALSLLAIAPASAQSGPLAPVGTVVGTTVGTAGSVAGSAVGAAGTVASAPFAAANGMMGEGSSAGQSCVSNGAFVPCAQPTMEPMGSRRMTRREMRAQRRMMQDDGTM